MTGKRKSSGKRKATQFQGTHEEVDTENVHIATGEDMETNIEFNVNTSEPEVMQEPHHDDHNGEDMSQDSNQFSRSSQIPQRRGPTKCVRFSSEINERLQIEFNEKGQPIGQNSIAYSTWLGVVARDVGPITISTWHKMTSDLKEKMWKMVKQKFIVPDLVKPMALKTIGKCWRQSKGRLRVKFYDIYDNDRDRIANCPSGIKIEEWRKFVTNTSKPEYKKQRERLKKVKECDKLPHTCSRKGYARLENEMKRNNDNPSSITRGDVWRKAHLKKNGEPVNDLAKEKIENLNEIPSSISYGKDDALSQVLGVDPRGRVRGVGYGITPSFLFGVQQSSLKLQHMEDELKIVKDELSCVKSMRAQMSSLEAKLAKSNSQEDQSVDQLSVQVPHEDQSLSIQSKKSNLQGDPSARTRVKCKLMSLCIPGDIIALGYWCSDDPTAIVHHCPLGDGMSKVVIEVALKNETPLVRGNDELKTIQDAVGSFVAWPTFFIIKE